MPVGSEVSGTGVEVVSEHAAAAAGSARWRRGIPARFGEMPNGSRRVDTFHVRQGSRVLAMLVLTVMAVSCSSGTTSAPPAASSPGGSGPVASTPDGGLSTSADADAAAVLASIKAGDAGSMDRLDALASRDDGVAAAQQVLTGHPDGDLRWAAAYVYAEGGTDPKPFAPYLTSDDTTVRVLAAAHAVLHGNVDGFAPLFDALGSDANLYGYAPTEATWQLASHVLAQTTGEIKGPPDDADQFQRTAAEGRWKQWFDDHKASLHFDADTKVWNT